MKLALAFGMPLAVLKEVITVDELRLWRAFDQLDPISLHHRIDLAGGVVASANINKGLGRDTKPTTPLDFMPVHLASEKSLNPKKGMAPDELAEFMRSVIVAQKERKGKNGPRTPHRNRPRSKRRGPDN